MRADEIENGAVSRIRPESAGGRRVKENCQVVHPVCASRKGAQWEVKRGGSGAEVGSVEAGGGTLPVPEDAQLTEIRFAPQLRVS